MKSAIPLKLKKESIDHEPYLPALLQSTEKLLLWPTKALLRPGPRLDTLLASESVSRGKALWEKLLLDLTAGSTVRVDVSLALVTFTSRAPKRGRPTNQVRSLLKTLFLKMLCRAGPKKKS